MAAPSTPSTPSAAIAVAVTVRYFAAARSAAGVESEIVPLRPGATIADLVESLTSRDAKLAAVLARCSYLHDGVAVRDRNVTLQSNETIDVLPPFAGG